MSLRRRENRVSAENSVERHLPPPLDFGSLNTFQSLELRS